MFSNNQQPLFRRGHDADDAFTVQASDANSNLGNLLLEADWDEAFEYLDTPEGHRDVDARNDPLGLSSCQPSVKNTHATIPSSKNTALFAALFVRAPYRLIEKILSMAPSHADHPDDLMYVLSVIPSEEEARSNGLRRKIPYRTRCWSADEYSQILNLLLKSFIFSETPSSTLLGYWPSWIIGDPTIGLTPLAIAAYNPDVPPNVVQLLCTLEPSSLEKECMFFGAVPTIPLIIAAASPLPPRSSSRYETAKSVRWEKVNLLILSKWYTEQNEALSKASGDMGDLAASPPPAPTLNQMGHACEEAMRRKEWELVREILKRHSPGDEAEAGDGIEKIQAALAQHDEQSKTTRQRQRKAREKAEAREEWMHKYAGFAMYTVDAVRDLVSAVMPKKQNENDGALVKPMS